MKIASVSLLVVALIACGRVANAEDHLSKPATLWTACPALDHLDDSGNPQPSLPSCTMAKPPVARCPEKDRIALVFDADSLTASRRTWKTLAQDPWNVKSTVCPANALQKDMPGWCTTIQDLAADGIGAFAKRCALTAKANRGSSTPATAAVDHLCGALSRDLPAAGAVSLDVAVLAFDGMVDDTGGGTPSKRFQEAIRRCVAQGLGVRVVTKPESYRYAYVFSTAGFHRYADDLAVSLVDSSAFHETRRAVGKGRRAMGDDPPAVVVYLTPHRWEEEGGMVAGVKPELSDAQECEAGSIGRNLETRDPSTDPPLRWVNIRQWSAAQDSGAQVPGPKALACARWTLRWTADARKIRDITPAGLGISLPKLWTNARDVGLPQSDTGDLAQDPRALLDSSLLDKENCPAPLRTQQAKSCPDFCSVPRGQVLSELHIIATPISDAEKMDERSSLSLLLARGPAALAGFDGKEPVEGFVERVRQSSVGPVQLPAVVLAMGVPQVDPCIHELDHAFVDLMHWGNKKTEQILSQGIRKTCATRDVPKIVQRLIGTPYAQFPAENLNSHVPPDLRGGVATLLGAMVESARLLSGEKGTEQAKDDGPSTWDWLRRPCMLRGLRIVYECGCGLPDVQSESGREPGIGLPNTASRPDTQLGAGEPGPANAF